MRYYPLPRIPVEYRECLGPPRHSSPNMLPFSNAIDMDKGCHITKALQEHALALHQMKLTPGIVNPSEPRSLEPLTSPGEVSRTCPSSSSSKDNSRSAGMLAPTLI